MPTIATHPTCEANLAWPQYRITAEGIKPMPCHQWRGLRTFFDENGAEHRFCASPGHLAQLVRRYGSMPLGDAIDAAMTEGELREAWGR